MSNAIEKLFDSVVPTLRQQDAEAWPRSDWELDEPHPYEDSRGSQDDEVLTIEDEARTFEALDRFGGRDEAAGVDRDLIEGGVRSRGMDALAFYKSRRFLQFGPFPGRWGIFYLEPGLLYLRADIAAEYPGIRSPAGLALNFVREHEHFHFLADVQTLMFEATLGKHLYVPLKIAMRGCSTDFVEEALANRRVMDWAKKPAVGIREFAYDFMKLQPGAYARFDVRRPVLAAEWAGTVVDLRPPGTHIREDLAIWVEATPRDLLRPSLCPEYLVRPASLSHWISRVIITPPVKSIVEGPEVQVALNGRYAPLRRAWEETKRKLMADRHLRGLDFKPWRQDGRGAYSVRVDKGFRAHLRHTSDGNWTAYGIGGHKEMGHG